MSYVALVRDSGSSIAADRAWPTATWRPTFRSWHPPGPFAPRFLCWWLFHYLGVFSNRDYQVVVAMNTEGTVVHRLGVFPRYFRFPFMSEADLQLGDLWTLPSHEGRGCATAAVLQAIDGSRSPGRRFWYIADPRNVGSVRVAQKAGFAVKGPAERTERFGLRLFGAFILTE